MLFIPITHLLIDFLAEHDLCVKRLIAKLFVIEIIRQHPRMFN